MRQLTEQKVHCLTDPWSVDAAVWEIDTNTLTTKKIKPFTDYFHQPFTEDVIW
ncbi:hypothetical protein SAMN04488122_4101 [Chitinophaga arvensicola]|uniref:Uncharacterized protein n=2 Tax=Chitinophaga arvensicola TaxID=29529 RepID=A0A1I0S6K0_9BACT|nr:hypothetical protein SAMN04488122_4101 [Chitinophaga arvensicola]